jgi:hypothetical protein
MEWGPGEEDVSASPTEKFNHSLLFMGHGIDERIVEIGYSC